MWGHLNVQFAAVRSQGWRQLSLDQITSHQIRSESAPGCCCRRHRQQLHSEGLDPGLVSRSPLTGSDRDRKGRGEGGGCRSRPYRISSLSEAAAYCSSPASLDESFSHPPHCVRLTERQPENSNTAFWPASVLPRGFTPHVTNLERESISTPARLFCLKNLLVWN